MVVTGSIPVAQALTIIPLRKQNTKSTKDEGNVINGDMAFTSVTTIINKTNMYIYTFIHIFINIHTIHFLLVTTY